MRKGLFLVLAALLLLGLTAGGDANPSGQRGRNRGTFGEHKGSRGSVGFILQMREALELTDEQVAKLRSIKMDAEKKRIQQEADLKTLHLDLEDLLHQDKVNRGKVDSSIDKMGKLHGEMKKLGVHARLDAKAVLTSDQLKKVKEHRKVGERKKMKRYHEEG